MPVFAGSEIAVGLDLVSISRIQRLLEEFPDRFRDYGFTVEEQTYCDEQAFPPQHYATRWSVKEAFIKAVGQPDANPDLTSIQVVHELPPRLSLSKDTVNLLEQTTQKEVSPEKTNIVVSMTHEQKADLAVGIVVIVF